MAIKTFLKIEGIEGASLAAKHKGEIDVLSFGWGIRNSATAGGGGGGAGKTEVSDFSFTKEVATDSPDLFVSVCKGEHHDQAILTVEGIGTDPKGKQGFYKVTFHDVLISGVSLGGQDNSVPMESVSLNFAKVEIEVSTPKGGSKVEVCDFQIGKF